MTANFQLEGLDFTALNGGPQFPFTEAVSFVVHCETQQEIDYYWDRLTTGGRPSQCGWLKDLGVTEVVVPLPPLKDYEAYLDRLRWIAAEVMPKVA